jgi:hypothetical protein
MSESPSVPSKTPAQQFKIEQSVGQNISESNQNPTVVNTSKQEASNPESVVDTLQ